MNINGRWYTETEAQAYIITLEHKLATLEEKHLSECRQISEYEAELREAKKEAILDGQTLIQSFAKTIVAILDSNGDDEATLEFDFKGRHFTAELYSELIGGNNND